MIEALTILVEQFSERTYTLRQVDPALFVDNTDTIGLYLAVCPFGTARGVINKTGPLMILVRITPSINGYAFHEARV